MSPYSKTPAIKPTILFLLLNLSICIHSRYSFLFNLSFFFYFRQHCFLFRISVSLTLTQLCFDRSTQLKCFSQRISLCNFFFHRCAFFYADNFRYFLLGELYFLLYKNNYSVQYESPGKRQKKAIIFRVLFDKVSFPFSLEKKSFFRRDFFVQCNDATSLLSQNQGFGFIVILSPAPKRSKIPLTRKLYENNRYKQTQPKMYLQFILYLKLANVF